MLGSGPGCHCEHYQENAASQAPLQTCLARTLREAQEARGTAAEEGVLTLGMRVVAVTKLSRVARRAEPEALPWQRAFVFPSLATLEPPCFLPGSGPSLSTERTHEAHVTQQGAQPGCGQGPRRIASISATSPLGNSLSSPLTTAWGHIEPNFTIR